MGRGEAGVDGQAIGFLPAAADFGVDPGRIGLGKSGLIQERLLFSGRRGRRPAGSRCESIIKEKSPVTSLEVKSTSASPPGRRRWQRRRSQTWLEQAKRDWAESKASPRKAEGPMEKSPANWSEGRSWAGQSGGGWVQEGRTTRAWKAVLGGRCHWISPRRAWRNGGRRWESRWTSKSKFAPAWSSREATSRRARPDRAPP